MNLRSKNFFKFLSIVLIVLIFLLGAFYLDGTYENKTKLSKLNSEYGLVAVDILDNSEHQQSFVLNEIFDANNLKTSIFDASKPKKELLVKIRNDDELSFINNVFLLELRTDANPEEIAKQYESLDIVSYAEPNFNVELSSDNDDYSGDDLLNFTKNNVENENDLTSKITVAVIDSGVDIEHKDLKGKVVDGYDFVSEKECVSDNLGHGTHVAGIIANNSSAKIMPIKFTDGKIGKLSYLAKAIKFAVDNDADVVNLSLGINENSSLLKAAIDYAVKKNVTVVAAAGNYNTNKKYYPAAYSKVISVTGLSNKEDKLPLSNFGTWVDYSVKAQDVYSALPDNKYGYETGTSQAAPFVSAKIADILDDDDSENNNLKSIISDLNKMTTPIKSSHYKGLLGRTLK